MSSALNLNEYIAQADAKPLEGDQLRQAEKVNTLGIAAVILAIMGIFVPFVLDIAAFILAKIAMRISRQNLVPIEYEKPAYWAYRVSITGIILWVVILIRIIA